MKKSPLLVVVLLLAGLVLVTSAYIVEQWEQTIITRFGEPVGQPVQEPGLYFKVPFIDTVHRFDKRFLEWDGKVTEAPTKEKQPILVDTYARWRIVDPLLFYQRLNNEIGAQARLDGILDGPTRDAVARHTLAELIRTSDREPVLDPTQEADESSTLSPIKIGREAIRLEILTNAQKASEGLGIEILDVQFKRINYVEAVRRSVFERMIAERRRIADRYRSEGEGEASRIRGDKELELKRITSEAYRRAQEIVGAADAKAIEIYAKAYDQSADARSFYVFLKTMETYSTTIDEETWLVMSTEADFYRYLQKSR
nr:protein HflC-like [Nerophis lumbriciformis]